MSTANEEMVADSKLRNLGGKYLTFALAEEDYGLEILRVREIIGMMTITVVPRTPYYVKGVVNLRGKIVPVIDIRLKFDMEAVEPTEQSCIIVVDVQGIEMGVVVDRVSEVLDIDAKNVEPPPQFGSSLDTRFILGMGKTDETVTILLDITRVLTDGEIDFIEGLSS